jgi:hypothetical protein
MLEINKALVLNLKGDRHSAAQLLGELALNPNSTFGTEHSAKAALSVLFEGCDLRYFDRVGYKKATGF